MFPAKILIREINNKCPCKITIDYERTTVCIFHTEIHSARPQKQKLCLKAGRRRDVLLLTSSPWRFNRLASDTWVPAGPRVLMRERHVYTDYRHCSICDTSSLPSLLFLSFIFTSSI